ncbi:MAG: bacteriocin-protection protein, partial [Acidobacteria bacterium]|nr:bacteriocin-protection protein [Acidobacteriota bacterium]
KWLEKNHDKKTELIVGFYKIGSGRKSIIWPEAVDQALCFGWIDGIRKSIDGESYCNRFTPRKPGSNWSAINIKKVEDLTAAGLMHATGIAAFEKRLEHRSRIYAYENEPVKLSPAFEKIFKSNQPAWKFFTTQAPSYQRVMVHWIMRAKQEETRLRRLNQTIAASSEQKRVS